jgi:hypothetical protein
MPRARDFAAAGATIVIIALGWLLWTVSFEAVNRLAAWSIAPLVQLLVIFGGLTLVDIIISRIAPFLPKAGVSRADQSADARTGDSS